MASLPHAGRKLYELPGRELKDSNTAHNTSGNSTLLNYINENIIGRRKTFYSAFGTRKSIYCDYTASGRSLAFIEEFIVNKVLPDYGNTHTTTSVTSLQTTLFRHEARDIVRNSVNASEHDAVIFVGSGCTGAIHKLLNALNLARPPVVFVGPYEHHSNLLPWREIGAQVVSIHETKDGLVDLRHLEHELKVWQTCDRQLIGAFAAASNITGTLVDVNAVTACLHRYGAFAFWDYATAAPYMDIDMNPVINGEDQTYVYKDAVFMSVHKFVGGVQTPGILVAKKALFRNPVPSGGGGGSVFFVRRDTHRYLQETEMREEGGTPAIVESIRAGLVFQLKQSVGTDLIQTQDDALCKKAFEKFSKIKELIILGSHTAPRLPIFSFMIKHAQSGLLLHYNFVGALLNDMFGIQARGGCACAGPYAQELLGIDPNLAKDIEDVLAEDSRLDRVHLRRYREYSDKEMLRPGFTRLNLPYFEDEETIDFIVEAVQLVAQHGWKMLPQYNFNPETGEWRHRKHQVFKDRKWLGNLSYETGRLTYTQPTSAAADEGPQSLQECLEIGRKLLSEANRCKVHLGDQVAMFDGETATLRWFLLPSEAYMWLQNPSQAAMNPKPECPFTPAVYPKKVSIDNKQQWTRCSCDDNAPSIPCVVHSCSSHCTTSVQNAHIVRTSSAEETNFETLLKNRLEQGFVGDNAESNSDTEFNRTNRMFKSDCDNSSCTLPVSGNPQTAGRETGKTELTALDNGNTCNNSLNLCNGDSTCTRNYSTIPVCANVCDTKSCESLKTDAQEAPTCIREKSTKKSDKHVSVDDNAKANNRTDAINRRQWHVPPKCIFKSMTQAIQQYSMIADGDRILVCLSGGKDSLSLLHSLRQYQFYGKNKGVNFSLGAVTIDPQTPSYDPSPLKAYLKTLGVPYFYEEQCIMAAAKNLPYECASICSFCSRMKRGRIYTAARREKYNVLALGQHIDDLAESFLMSMFHNGLLRTMKASYTVKQGDLKVIRPLVYVREKDLRAFAEKKQLPVIAENCPACFEEPKERFRMKQLLASQEVLHPRLFHSIQSAISPLMAINKTGVNINTLLGNFNHGQDKQEQDIDEL